MLELADIRKNRGAQVVLNGVSLSIGAGEIFAILGPSGCGKTTLLRAIAGLETIDKGSMSYQGRSLNGVPAHDRPFHLVFQKYALFPHLNVADNIGFGLRFKKLTKAERHQKIASALDLVRLSGFEKRSIETLSGGQAQRVALARSLILEPKVLLLDEPLAALDPQIKQNMQLELKELQRRVGVTFVIVTHDQEEALFLADRIAVMNHGRIEQTGRSQDIYGRPESRFVAHFMGEMNELTGRVCTIEPDQIGVQVAGTDLPMFTALPQSTTFRPKLGDTVTLFVRPEHVKVGDATVSKGRNMVRARVASVSFRGPLTRVHLYPEGEAPSNLMVAYILGHGDMGDDTPQIGQSIYVSWSRDHATLLGDYCGKSVSS